MSELDTLKTELLTAVNAAEDLAALDAARVAALGKKGAITGRMKGLGALEPDERKSTGQALNALRDEVQAAVETRRSELEDADIEKRLATEKVDVTLPARPSPMGRIHPISQTIEEVTAIFGEMGFQIAEGPDIENDWYNFTALNTPREHPARQMQDTFYMANSADQLEGAGAGGPASDDDREIKLLRTHTSPVQVRTLLNSKPPVRILCPGRVFRCDSDRTHTPMFHQFEGLVIDESTHMGHLKGCLLEFCEAYFEAEDIPLRFRPSHFPFTEPSAEVDIGCNYVDGQLHFGHRGDEHDDWLEILGSGMVHPNVLEMCGIDSSKYQGFAFGMGCERITMLKYGIPDGRTFFDPDLRWLRHYGFVPLDTPTLTGGLGQ